MRRSPFIDKDSQEHFEVRTHKRLIDVLDPDSKTIDTLMRLNLPAGVDIEIKILHALQLLRSARIKAARERSATEASHPSGWFQNTGCAGLAILEWRLNHEGHDWQKSRDDTGL